jgi:multicomponent Na+:H+ antiporter subunit F
VTEFLLGAAVFVLATVALGLVRILRGPSDADRLLAAQLLGTGGVAALLLFGVATAEAAAADLALVLTLLAAFATVGFVTGTARPGAAGDPPPEAVTQGDSGRPDDAPRGQG